MNKNIENGTKFKYCCLSNFTNKKFSNIIKRLKGKGKGKAFPLQAWTGPEGSQEVKVPRFHDNGTGWW